MMQKKAIDQLLVKKYNQPIPRYTSYPTVPSWQNVIDTEKWKASFASQFSIENAVNGISIYIHLPFCESLCTYCGCNKKITQNHSAELEYIDALEKEWTLYRKYMRQAPVIREIHLGGGTPTFFSPRNLNRLINMLIKNSVVHPYYEFSIEGHPNNTTKQHLDTLFSLGFRRISYGVQDLDEKVQHVINRVQPFEKVRLATEAARAAGFTSVNFDLIYGLPLQTVAGMEDTLKQVIQLRPDRIAFYSYAHVPWTSKAQRLFDERDLPSAEEKIRLYLQGVALLSANGYFNIGMDHFALPHDELYKAKQHGRLHRNFMGYTTRQTGLLLGLGVSSISDIGNTYVQNDKTLHNYYELINEGKLPVKKGYFLSSEDMAFRKYIMDIACKENTLFNPVHLPLLEEYCLPQLKQFAEDGLVAYDEAQLVVTEEGHYFIRNICSAFDLYLQRNKDLPNQQLFSKSI